MVVPDDGVSPS
jgi:hypothetical protein